jgi:hypothetical protein
MKNVAEFTYDAGKGVMPIGGKDFTFYGDTQQSVVHSDGSIVVLARDTVNTAPQEMKLYRSTNGGDSWTLVKTVTAPAGVIRVAIAQGPAGQIGILASAIYDMSFTEITWSTWANTAWQTVKSNNTSQEIGHIDLDYSDDGEAIAAYQTYRGAVNGLWTHVAFRTVAGVWSNPTAFQLYGGGTRRAHGEGVSVAMQYNSVSPGKVIVTFVTSGANQYGDTGLKVYTVGITKSTGAQATTPVLQVTKVQGVPASVAPPSKIVWRSFRCWQMDTNKLSIMSLWFDKTTNRYKTASYYIQITAAEAFSDLSTAVSDIGSFSNNSITSVGLTCDTARNNIFHLGHQYSTGMATKGVVHYWGDNGTSRAYEYDLYYEWITPAAAAMNVSHGCRRNLNLSKQGFGMAYYDSTSGAQKYVLKYGYELVPNRIDGTAALVGLVPSAGAVEQVGQPLFQATAQTGDGAPYNEQGLYRVEFQTSTTSDFSTGNKNLLQSKSKARTLRGLNSNSAGLLFAEQTSSVHSKTLWYYRARLVDIYGNVGAWTVTQSFSVGHPPAAILQTPRSGVYYPWSGGLRNFFWEFTDPFAGDVQTAAQVVVRRVSDNTIQFDSGKVMTAAESMQNSPAFAGGLKDIELSWTARLWDSDDSVGGYAPAESFLLGDPPTVVVNNPSVNEEFETGVPTFQFTPTTFNSRTITRYTISVTQGAATVYSLDRVLTTPSASGVAISHKIPQGFLVNDSSYSVQVTVTDSGGLSAVSSLVAFTTSWTPPATPTVGAPDTSEYNVEEKGYISVYWSDTGRDVDFTGWEIQRKADLINPNTLEVLEEGAWETLYSEYLIDAAGYEFRDYFAPAGYLVTYQIIQWVNRDEQDIPSLPGVATGVVPISDGYWIIEPSLDAVGADAFKLSIVTSDSFAHEQEETEFVVIGRGRVVNKGQRLGRKGTLEIQLRDTGGTTARQKQLRLVDIQERTRQAYLRNPFGDIFKVSVSNMSIGRIAGVGRSEFCDVSIPYSEVS